MRFPVNDYKKRWYNAQGFGERTSYGYHEGADINLRSGGNTDLGQPLYAIADGTVTSVHIHTTAFGKHLHIQHDGPWGKVWSHYAHCQSILVKYGDKVKEGQKVATLGSSGNSRYAHLHFCIKLQPTGIDGIARTLSDLKKWTDPILFIEKWSKGMPSDGEISLDKETFERLVKKSTLYDEFKGAGYETVAQLKEAIQNLKNSINDKNQEIEEEKTRAEECRKEIKFIFATLADDEHLHTTQDWLQIEAAARKAGVTSSEFEDLKLAYAALQTSSGTTESKLKAEIAVLKEQLKQNNALETANLRDFIVELVRRLKSIVKDA